MRIFFTIIFVLFLTKSPMALEIIDKDATETENLATRMFNELDLNKDGKITLEEMKAFSQREFKIMDKKNKEKILREEFFEFSCDKSCRYGNCECKEYKDKSKLDYMQQYWNRLDRDSKGYITVEDKYRSDLEDFATMDTQRKGYLTKKDFESQFY